MFQRYLNDIFITFIFLITKCFLQELLTQDKPTQTVQVFNSSARELWRQSSHEEDWTPHESEPLIYSADKEFRDETVQDHNATFSSQIEKKCAQLALFTPNLCENKDAKEKCNICKTFPKHDFISCGKREPSGIEPSRKREPIGIPIEKAQKKSKVFKRIVGGNDSNPGEWPWQVSIFRGGKEQFCGGAILSKDFILTSSHIFGKGWVYPEDWSVISGDHWRSKDDPNSKRHFVKKIIHHKDFAENFGAHAEKIEIYYSKYDIAILQLNDSIEIHHENKGSICLPDSKHPIPMWATCYITGWGVTKYKGNAPQQLRKSLIKLMPHTQCNSKEVYNGTIDESTLCAGFVEPGIGTCNGDSGGSLACYEKGRWYSTGVVSGGYRCGQAKYAPSIFANVTYLKDWIVSTIINHSDDVT